MPSFVGRPVARLRRGAEGAALEVPPSAELAPRNCTLRQYTKRVVRSVEVSDQIIAYASPDSTFAVTKRLLDAARRSILIGIYDFTADHAKQIVLGAMRRGVKVELMLDIDGRAEQELFDELARFGAQCTPAPSCASKRARFFRSSHEKVIVIDNEWTLVQSGNYSANSIPLNVEDGGDPAHFTTGNRDTGLAVRSPRLAAFFRRILESDIRLELAGPEAAAAFEAAADPFLVEAAPRRVPEQLFPSKTFELTEPLTVRPVLSPDNYMKVVPGLLEGAQEAILIEQQYIRATQSEIVRLLSAIKRCPRPQTRPRRAHRAGQGLRPPGPDEGACQPQGDRVEVRPRARQAHPLHQYRPLRALPQQDGAHRRRRRPRRLPELVERGRLRESRGRALAPAP